MISMMSLNNKLYKKVIRYLYTGENCGRQSGRGKIREVGKVINHGSSV